MYNHRSTSNGHYQNTDQTLKAIILQDKQKNTITLNQDDKTSVPRIYTIRPSRITF